MGTITVIIPRPKDQDGALGGNESGYQQHGEKNEQSSSSKY
jgi:hypothetical protein